MQANFYDSGKYWELKEGEEVVISHLILEQIPLDVVLNFVEEIDTEEDFEALTLDQQKDILEQFRSEFFPTEIFGEYLLDNWERIMENLDE